MGLIKGALKILRVNSKLLVVVLSCKSHYVLWLQLENIFQLTVTPQGLEELMIQLKDTPSKVYAIGTELFLSKLPLEVLQN